MKNQIAYKKITERVLAELDKGVVAWKQPWITTAPRNYFSKREYNGINFLMCMLAKSRSMNGLLLTKSANTVSKSKKGQRVCR